MCRRQELNLQPELYEGSALTIELRRRNYSKLYTKILKNQMKKILSGFGYDLGTVKKRSVKAFNLYSKFVLFLIRKSIVP